jgi:threonine/homoserine/homoserine lactone efflux protein
MGAHLWVFLGISAVVIVVPGRDTALVTKNAVLHGRRAALGTALGVNTGLAVWTVACALGVASVIEASGTAFTALKLIGAAVLWLHAYAVVAVKASELLRRPRVSAALDRLSGVILIGFGVRIALERR